MINKVSIIIPVYNVEKYIEECLESVIRQTYKNVEVILIDDGSTDKSGKICDIYMNKDSRIKVIHKKNEGAASAKNIGLKNISGTYVMFVDSDDVIDKKCVENKVRVLEETDADIVQTKFLDMFKNNTQKYTSDIKNKLYKKDEFLLEYIKYWECAIFWNKLYKKEVLKDIEFIEGRCIDDEFFTYKIIQNSKKIVISNTYDYYYRHRKSSVMNDFGHRKKILKDQIDFIYIRFLDIDKKNKSIRAVYLENLVDTYLLLSKDSVMDEETLKYLKHKIRSVLGKILTYKFENKILKILIIKLMLSPTKNILSKKNIFDKREESLSYYFD